ncbi:hypothetical protein BD779DRAFT_1218951 [Infundibulicybe gibba]|nr:hypothetical protein BD779DRAFT_1218951 [Infundibulicybe gibba]
MSGDLLLIVDDASDSISHGGGQWSISYDPRWYRGSSAWPAFAADANGDTGVYGSLNYTFHGTSIAFVGNTPPSKDTQTVTVTIDDNLPYNASYDDPNPQTYRQWYQSPDLDDGIHTIQLNNIVGAAVDFITVSVGPGTPLVGQKIIVDDDDPSIVYSGNWTRNGSPFFCAESPPKGLPFHNGTHQSTTPGDTAAVRFTGSSIALYGIFSWVTLGSMSVTYTLDGSSSITTYDVTPSTPEFTSHLLQHQNYLLFSNDSFAPGDHTLLINVTKVDNLTFLMDYLTYSPSFASLATKPNLTAPATFTSLPPTSAHPASPESSTSINGTVVGVAAGVVGAMAVLMLALFIIHNRRRRHQATNDAAWERMSSKYSPPPVTLPRRTSAGYQNPGIEPYLLTYSFTGGDTNSDRSVSSVITSTPSPPNSLYYTADSSLTANGLRQSDTGPRVETLQPTRAVEGPIMELETKPDDKIFHENRAGIPEAQQRIGD